jgi:5'-nucleotidase
MEGVIAGVPAIAVSLNSHTSNDFGVAGRFAAQLARQVLARGLPEGVLLNANVPPLPADQIAGVLVTRMGLRIYRDELVRRLDPRGRPYYWIGGPPPTGVEEEGVDRVQDRHLGHRPRLHLGHPHPTRPHRPRHAGYAAGVGPGTVLN